MYLKKLFINKVFFKFIIVGIINTVFGAVIMFCLYNLFNAGYWLSSAANYFLGSILSFFLNKYFTFSVKEWSLYIIVAFIVNIVISYFIAYGAIKPVMNYFLRNIPIKTRENITLITGMCLFTGINYLGQRLVVFKNDKT